MWRRTGSCAVCALFLLDASAEQLDGPRGDRAKKTETKKKKTRRIIVEARTMFFTYRLSPTSLFSLCRLAVVCLGDRTDTSTEIRVGERGRPRCLSKVTPNWPKVAGGRG